MSDACDESFSPILCDFHSSSFIRATRHASIRTADFCAPSERMPPSRKRCLQDFRCAGNAIADEWRHSFLSCPLNRAVIARHLRTLSYALVFCMASAGRVLIRLSPAAQLPASDRNDALEAIWEAANSNGGSMSRGSQSGKNLLQRTARSLPKTSANRSIRGSVEAETTGRPNDQRRNSFSSTHESWSTSGRSRVGHLLGIGYIETKPLLHHGLQSGWLFSRRRPATEWDLQAQRCKLERLPTPVLAL